MYINGLTEYDRQGKEEKTGLVVGRATCDGELRFTTSGKAVGSFSVVAHHNKDGTATFLSVKAWGDDAKFASSIQKGDTVLAAGRLSSREYNGKTYTDLIADIILNFSLASGAPLQPPTPITRPVSGAVNVPADDFEEISEGNEVLPF